MDLRAIVESYMRVYQVPFETAVDAIRRQIKQGHILDFFADEGSIPRSRDVLRELAKLEAAETDRKPANTG